MTKYTVAALLAFGLIGSAQADNTVIDSLKLTATNPTTTPWISMPNDATPQRKLVSDTVEADLQATESRLKTELLKQLADVVNHEQPSN